MEVRDLAHDNARLYRKSWRALYDDLQRMDVIIVTLKSGHQKRGIYAGFSRGEDAQKGPRRKIKLVCGGGETWWIPLATITRIKPVKMERELER